MGKTIIKWDTFQFFRIFQNIEKEESLGCGFLFLRKDWIVTAKHVVVDEDGNVRQNIYAKYQHIEINCEVTAIHDEIDIAILLITEKENPCHKPLYLGYSDLSVIDEAMALAHTPSSGGKFSFTTIKKFDESTRERSTEEHIIEFESDTYEPGSSGGIIFGQGTTVIGVIINTFKNDKYPEKSFVRATSINNLMNEISIEIKDGLMTKLISKDEK